MLRDMMSEPVKGEVGFAPGACLPWDNRSARRVGVLINRRAGRIERVSRPYGTSWISISRRSTDMLSDRQV